MNFVFKMMILMHMSREGEPHDQASADAAAVEAAAAR